MDDPDRLYAELDRLTTAPGLYAAATAEDLWTDPAISEMMLRFHLDGEVDVASRRTAFIDASVAWMVERFSLGTGRRVIDLGCGPGLYTTRLARTGASVTGVDFSARSIEHARAAAERDGLSVDHVRADYLDWTPDEPADLVMMIMCDYCALTPTQRERLLGRLPELLAPDGSFVFDVYSMALFDSWEERVVVARDLMDGFWSSLPYIGVLGTFRYDEPPVALERYTIVEEERIREFFNWFRHFDPATLEAEVEAAGLRVRDVLGDVAGGAYDPDAPEFAVVVSR